MSDDFLGTLIPGQKEINNLVVQQNRALSMLGHIVQANARATFNSLNNEAQTQYIKTLRNEQDGLTQAQVGTFLGISQPEVSLIERGKK